MNYLEGLLYPDVQDWTEFTNGQFIFSRYLIVSLVAVA